MTPCHRADFGTTRLVSHRVGGQGLSFCNPKQGHLHYSVAGNPSWQTGGSSSHMHRGLIENPEPSISINTYGMLPGYSKNRPWLSGGHSSWGISDVFSLAAEYHCNQERGAYADQIISPFFTKMTYMQASFWSSHRTAFTRFELQWQSAQYVKGLSSLSHELCLCALQCYCWEHGQLNVSIIFPASCFYRCTSCFTNRSVYCKMLQLLRKHI